MYFRGLRSVSKVELRKVFLDLNDEVPVVDVVKLAILHLISSFLFTTSYKKCVDDVHMRLVDSDDMANFAWGYDLFQITIRHMKLALNPENKNQDVGKKAWSYRLYGFPISLQIWAYEIIPCLNGTICTKIGEGSARPRFLNWEADVTVSGSQLEKDLFDLLIASIEFNAHSADPPQSNPTGAFDGASNSRGFTGDGENKQDEFEKNDFNNYTEFETEVQVEDNDGSQFKDFEVQSQVQYDRKGKGKAVFCDKTKNESVHHGATEFEKIEQDDDIIQIDDITSSAPRRRTRKTAAVYRSPYISEFVSSGKSKAVIREIRSCTSALRDEINAIDVNDIVDFEEWFNMGLCKNNKKKKFNDNNKMISPPFSFGILEVVDKKWFYDLRTPEECLTDTAMSSSFVDWSAYDGKDPFDELDIHILGKIPQQYQRLV
ncbi:Sentrin-specific protease 1 [Forsythia ovata]|uniref:Sentrin-specific protease 1 n=1 Tax=Forsythia ovata TaxID=205694 RepID=A0ABD1WSW9_9LAMI